MKFVVVNGRTPRPHAFCALCKASRSGRDQASASLGRPTLATMLA